MATHTLDAIIAFGERLLYTRDLDPVYVAIHGAVVSEPQLCRLLLAYAYFYHLGFSSWSSEAGGDSYWRRLMTAAENTTPSPLGGRWPRGTERRHFRGPKCVAAIDHLRRWPAEDWIRALAVLATAEEIMAAVKAWPMCGNWISFKMVDLMERCYGANILCQPSVPLMYDEPRRALDLLPEGAYQHLLVHFAAFKAPPRYDRPCGPLEVETILCKWKSSLGGHYPMGKDTYEVIHGLTGWGTTADRLSLAVRPLYQRRLKFARGIDQI